MKSEPVCSRRAQLGLARFIPMMTDPQGLAEAYPLINTFGGDYAERGCAVLCRSCQGGRLQGWSVVARAASTGYESVTDFAVPCWAEL